MTGHEDGRRDGFGVVRQITDLLRSRPPLGADDESRAAWFEEKATVFDAIAEQDPHAAAECGEMAEQARLYAGRLRRGVP